ncbi:uncharacterized protein TM35_000432070 [Trypanosoma theileri]|uniref:Uncharacterized protein n=1 Tax=Trypanosoma theileri TaxID=67003 RepID=A0A1X0NKE2_9TRYP|nr:uncharacterized protein TM35_000432070 [Trypanosoma theileri]ORC84639.1 hypothetical protein TM35_000432070 [Trypanosoma theileri]
MFFSDGSGSCDYCIVSALCTVGILLLFFSCVFLFLSVGVWLHVHFREFGSASLISACEAVIVSVCTVSGKNALCCWITPLRPLWGLCVSGMLCFGGARGALYVPRR